MEKLLQLLSTDPIFSQLDSGDRERLVRLASKRQFYEGEIIAHYGSPWPNLFITESGVINILKLSPEGRTLGALRLEAGEIFWSPSFFDDGPLPASLEVREKSLIHLWRRDDILPVLRNNNKVMWSVCLFLAKRIRTASEYVEGLAFQPVAGRLAELLLSQFQSGEDQHVQREMTLEEMGTVIGTTPVMVCKILSRFAADGLIEVNRTQFKMIDRQGLRRIIRD